MEKVLNLFKRSGETPLERIERFRVENPEYKNAKLSYAGRLDPMAEGVLFVMVGSENKNRDKYLNLPKDYYFEILFGFSTDTYDILGLVLSEKTYSEIDIELLRRIVDGLKGKQIQQYPPYSSKTVSGKPLFEYAKEGSIDDIDIPEREIEIFDIRMEKIFNINKDDMWRDIERRITKVKGDFRQKEIGKKWMETLLGNPQKEFAIISFRVSCTSGTYVRGIANSIGETLNIPALAWKIVRQSVGDLVIRDSK